jgi:hypothetical protein
MNTHRTLLLGTAVLSPWQYRREVWALASLVRPICLANWLSEQGATDTFGERRRVVVEHEVVSFGNLRHDASGIAQPRKIR